MRALDISLHYAFYLAFSCQPAFPIWTPRLGKIYSGLRHTRSTWSLVLARLGFIGTVTLHEHFFPFRSVYLPCGEGVLQASPVIYLYPFIFFRLHTSLRILSPHSKARRVVVDDSRFRGLYELARSQVSHLGLLSLSLLLSSFISQRITAFLRIVSAAGSAQNCYIPASSRYPERV